MTKKEYIEREAIEYPYKTMSMWGLNSNECEAYNKGVKAVEDYIANLPAADVVEVVRCKNCKYYDIEYGVCDFHSVEPDAYSSGAKVEMAFNDFCSYGERKTENGS